MSTPQENARLEQIKRSWDQRRQITDRLAGIKSKIGVYSGCLLYTSDAADE